jgi:putative transposase
LLGKEARGLSATTVGRLKEAWSDEHARWSKRDLSTKRYVYFWADGIHAQARLEDAAQCLLVIIGATPGGKKELVGLIDGVRESAQSWKGLLLDLKRGGLAIGPEPRGRRRRPRLLAGDRTSVAEDPRPALLGAQGRQCAQQAAEEPAIESQAALQEIWMAETKKDALAAFDAFVETGGQI